jgi:hypothetical protein
MYIKGILYTVLIHFVTKMTHCAGKIVDMMKNAVMSSALLTGVLLGTYSTLTTHATQNNQNASAAVQVDVKAVDSAVKSLKQVEPVKKAVNTTPKVSQTTAPVATQTATSTATVVEVANTATEDSSSVEGEPSRSATVEQTTTAQTDTATDTTTDAGLQDLIQRESSGNTSASNGQYYGIGQLSPANYEKYVSGQDWQNSYAVQLAAMKAYITDRYGSVANAVAFHNANGWY